VRTNSHRIFFSNVFEHFLPFEGRKWPSASPTSFSDKGRASKGAKIAQVDNASHNSATNYPIAIDNEDDELVVLDYDDDDDRDRSTVAPTNVEKKVKKIVRNSRISTTFDLLESFH
jgi:hypothetical protein